MSTRPEDGAQQQPTTLSGKSRLERFSRSVGRFFSDLNYLLKALGSYVILSLITFLLLLWPLWPHYQKAGFIAYKIATGGDPFNFTADVGHYRFVWTWLLLLHTIAWIAVPALIGTAVDAAYRVYEDRRYRAAKTLQKIMRKKAATLGLPETEIDNLVEQTMESFKRRRKG